MILKMEIYIMVISKMAKVKEKENIIIKMEIYMMVISKMAKEKEKENVLINNLEINMMVIGKTIK